MKAICFYYIGNIESTFVVFEDGEKYVNPSIGNNKECIYYFDKKYKSLGKTFNDAWNYVKKHNEDPVEYKNPFFWDEPSIKVITENLEK